MRISCALFVLFATAVAAAQTNTGQVSGMVRDSSGGVLPGATITITNIDTGVPRSPRRTARSS